MDLLGVRSLPFLSRRNYYYEFKHIIPWSMLAGLIEGQFAAVVISKTFHGSSLLIAIASATPMASLLFSLIWGMLCIGRPKIRVLVFFAAGTALCTGMIGAIPATPVGAIWFLAQIAAAQVLLSGVVTVRSAVWKSNYPRESRGQITARLQRIRRLVSVVTVLAAAGICDHDPTAYRYVFPAGAVFGLIGVWLLPKIHIRGERNELRRDRLPAVDGDLQSRMVEPFSLTALLSPGHVLGQMVRVLREDRRFARYCIAQLLTGTANLMTIPIIVALVTRELRLDTEWGFWVSTALIVALPSLVLLGSIGRWGRLFDRLGVVRMRVINVACWTASLVFAMAAALVILHAERVGPASIVLAVALFAGRGALNGLGLGGGTLAWNLGHLHFAQPQQAEIYMGIHVSLTGLRGLVAPLGGMWFWHTIGWPVWLIAIALSLSSLVLYASMARSEPRRPKSAPATW